jgi:RNA polymerase sigma-70 factor (ECF subfamily)
MRIYEEKKFAAIAEELGLPLGTVLTRMRLALKKLAASLNPEDSNQ